MKSLAEVSFGELYDFIYIYKLTPNDFICDYDIPAIKENGRRCYTLANPSKFYLIPERSVFIKNFLKGAVRGIENQLIAKQEKTEQSIEIIDKQTTALVKVHTDQIALFMHKHYKQKIKSCSSSQGGSLDFGAYKSGIKAGEELFLGQGIEGKSIKMLN